MSTVRVRFAPSPTGYFHAGSARTLLFNWLFARRHGGKFILRIEDTDQTRYHPDALPDLLSGTRWLGLDWDEGPEVGGPFGPYFQSQRLPLYREHAQKLVASGHAYPCYCSEERLAQMREEQKQGGESPGYDRRCRELTAKQRSDLEAQGITPVVRLKVPLEGETGFTDLIRGEIRAQNATLDDLVLLKSDGYPTYHLAVVVDDHWMEISHIMRSVEWIPTTSQRILIHQGLCWTPPLYAHLPVILSPTGTGKMSKRKTVGADGQEYSVQIREFRAEGYLPEALFNFLALIGWSYDDQTELLTQEQIIAHFDLDRVSKSPAKFNYEKLDWMNGQHIRRLAVDDLTDRLQAVLERKGLHPEPGLMEQVVPMIQERLVTLNDAVEMTDFMFTDDLRYESATLVDKSMTAESARLALAEARAVLTAAPDLHEGTIEPILRAKADELGLKLRLFLGPLRVAVTGKTVSPPLFGTISILGRDRVLARIARAEALLAELSA